MKLDIYLIMCLYDYGVWTVQKNWGKTCEVVSEIGSYKQIAIDSDEHTNACDHLEFLMCHFRNEFTIL